MRAETRKTLVIIAAAGGLVAAAITLERPSAGGGAAAAPRVVEPTVRPAAAAPTCDGSGPARTSVDTGLGSLGGALSTGKILRGIGGTIHAAFDLDTRAATPGPRPPLNLAIVVDRSGSMAGDKIAHARDAARGIVDRLDATDRVALIQYDDAAQVVLASIKTDAEGKARLGRAIAALDVGGSTNLHGGLELGREEIERTLAPGEVSRVILLSDGQANAGVTDPAKIADAARSGADRGVRVTAVGLGLGFNEDLMEAIAEAGRGKYYYVRDGGGLAAVMEGELSGIQGTVATAVELRLRPACAGVELVRVVGYDSRRDGDALVVPLADLFGSDRRKLLVEVKVPDRVAGGLGVVRAELSFRDARSGQVRSQALALALEVTDDRHAAEAAVDRDVMAQVLQVQAADTMRQAAAAYDKGDQGGALQLLSAGKASIERARGRYAITPAAAGPALGALDAMENETASNRPGTAEAQHISKENKKKARALTKER